MDSLLSETKITAFMENPDAPRPSNPIHSTDGGKAYGYRAALIGGANVYGWAVPEILKLLGETWLRVGWIDVSFRRPTYPGDEMTIRILSSDPDYELEVNNQDGQHCLLASFGAGDAPWLGDISVTRHEPGQPAVTDPPQLTRENAPVGQALLPRAIVMSLAETGAFARDLQADSNPIYEGPDAIVHPASIASQPIHLLHHSYSYGPAIHTRSQIQNLAVVRSDQRLTMTGLCHEVFERKGHQYIVNDCAVWSEAAEELTRIRHTVIFNVAKRAR